MSAGWVRRWFGPSRAELRAEAELWRGRCEQKSADVAEAHARVKEYRRTAGLARHEVHNLSEQLARAKQELALAAEPATGCTKVRLHHREDAQRWAAKIEAGTRSAPGALVTYPCRTCPRSPVTDERYWHVGHRDPADKREAMTRWAGDLAEARRGGLTVAQRVDPRVLAKLRERS